VNQDTGCIYDRLQISTTTSIEQLFSAFYDLVKGRRWRSVADLGAIQIDGTPSGVNDKGVGRSFPQFDDDQVDLRERSHARVGIGGH
jgi:hypothetical protein